MIRYSAVIFFILTFRFTVAQDRIVGGTDANIKNWGYQVALLYDGNNLLCGGSLIRDDWVCTAAHCLEGYEISVMQIRLGSSFAEKYGVLVEVEQKIVHPDYQKTAPLDNDIGLLKLKNKITDEQKTKFGIYTIALCENWPQPDEICWVTGYGISSDGSFPEQLQKVQVRAMRKEVCRKDYGQKPILTPSMQCAGLPNGGKDWCEGDSGGPLAYNDRLCGVASWGIGCGLPEYPGVYTSIPFWRNWIIFHVDSD